MRCSAQDRLNPLGPGVDWRTTGAAGSELVRHPGAVSTLDFVRYEAAVRTNLTFHTQRPPYALPFPEPETVLMEFEGRRFVWHTLGPTDEGEARWPTVATMVVDPNDYEDERVAMEQFLSALSYWTSHPIEVLDAGGAGWKQEMEPAFLTAPRRGLADHLHQAPSELVITDDPRLKMVFGYYRDAMNTGSPFFKFLAFWNALEVACEDLDGRLPNWIRTTLPRYAHLRGGDEQAPDDWWEHLQNERRSAVAHAVRDPGRGPDLDPNDPADRGKLGKDARLLEQLVRIRVQQRWGDHPLWPRPRDE
jgi:hypothetical protein